MKSISAKKLVPGEHYFLKWVGRFPYSEILIFECQFIKYFDNTYGKDCLDYLDLTDDNSDPNNPELLAIKSRLRGNILDDNYKLIKTYPFDHPFAPYTYQFPGGMLPAWDKDVIGLFRYIRFVKLVIDGKDITNKFNDQNIEAYLKKNRRLEGHLYKTMLSNKSGILVPNETLMWVNFDHLVKIKEANAEQRIVHKKTLEGIEQILGRDPTSEVAGFVGSTEYLQSLKKGGKKTKKNKKKSNVKKNKSKRR